MDDINLGGCGLRVSRLCLGMMGFGDASPLAWVIDEAAAEPIVRAAWEGGVTFFDTADIYSDGASEVATGRLLRGLGVDRDQYVVGTKVGLSTRPGPNGGGLSRAHVLDAVDRSLRRLEMDHVDLYQVHRWDPHTPVEETMEALHDVVRAGKARYLGASSMYAWQLAKAQEVARANGWTPFVSMQNHYNLVYREEEREMLPLCADQGLGVIPWSPLARGLLTGTRTRDGVHRTARSASDAITESYYGSAEDFDVVEQCVAVAQQRGDAPAQVALAWLLSRPQVTAPIVGATKLAHLQDALGALSLSLSDDEIAALEAPYRPHPVLGHR